jgi:orotate phosphoribosyltransferase
MNFRSTVDLSRAAQQWALNLPADIDLIVGVPRSGLVPAALVALHRNLPFTDIERLLESKLIESGKRGFHLSSRDIFREGSRILIIDDSVLTGTQIQKVKQRIADSQLPYRVEYGAVYIAEDAEHMVDYWYEIVMQPRVFEWNLMHHNFLEQACVDIDGVLCRDPSDGENDDGEKYRQFISTVPPRVIPSQEVGWLVTCRLEKYRLLTEKWLRLHGIRYRQMIMMDYPDKATRQSADSYGLFKARVYKNTGAILFIESSSWQAIEISRLTGKAVYCVQSGNIVHADALNHALTNPKEELKKVIINYSTGRKALRIYRKTRRSIRSLMHMNRIINDH